MKEKIDIFKNYFRLGSYCCNFSKTTVLFSRTVSTWLRLKIFWILCWQFVPVNLFYARILISYTCCAGLWFIAGCCWPREAVHQRFIGSLVSMAVCAHFFLSHSSGEEGDVSDICVMGMEI